MIDKIRKSIEKLTQDELDNPLVGIAQASYICGASWMYREALSAFCKAECGGTDNCPHNGECTRINKFIKELKQ